MDKPVPVVFEQDILMIIINGVAVHHLYIIKTSLSEITFGSCSHVSVIEVGQHNNKNRARKQTANQSQLRFFNVITNAATDVRGDAPCILPVTALAT